MNNLDKKYKTETYKNDNITESSAVFIEGYKPSSVTLTYDYESKSWIQTDIPNSKTINLPDVAGATPTLCQYEGDLKDRKPNGFGTLGITPKSNAYSTSYTGEWKDGRYHGEGKLAHYFSSHSCTYKGQFKNGLQHGYGEEHSISGVYKGFWANGEKRMQNKLKIVSNIKKKTINYYLKNGDSEWELVSNASLLSREKYTKTFIKDISNEIIEEIDRTYNIANIGVGIIFQGTDEEYKDLNKAIEEFDPESEYITISKTEQSKIIFAGKIKSGKTILIEELCNYNNFEYNKIKEEDYEFYDISNVEAEVYEVNGIDMGRVNIKYCESVIGRLISNGDNTLIYCISSTKIEQLEIDLLHNLKRKFPSTNIIIGLTYCINENIDDFKEVLDREFKKTEVISLLAREISTRCGTISAYGIDELSAYIF